MYIHTSSDVIISYNIIIMCLDLYMENLLNVVCVK